MISKEVSYLFLNLVHFLDGEEVSQAFGSSCDVGYKAFLGFDMNMRGAERRGRVFVSVTNENIAEVKVVSYNTGCLMEATYDIGQNDPLVSVIADVSLTALGSLNKPLQKSS